MLESFPRGQTLHIVLYEPEIPHNTGAVARLCVATQSTLHLVGKLGFSLSESAIRRVGLDYWQYLKLETHADFEAISRRLETHRWFFLSTKGRDIYSQHHFHSDDVFMFGSESKGLPSRFTEDRERCLRIPIFDERVRSLNLSTAAAVIMYEVIRQTGMGGN